MVAGLDLAELSGELAEPDHGAGVALGQADRERIGRYLSAATAESTEVSYKNDWADFTAWCSQHGHIPLPAEPEVVAAYLTHLADIGRAPTTIRRRSSSINAMHQRAGFSRPGDHAGVRTALRGIRRAKAQDGYTPRKARPLDPAMVRAMVEDLPPTLAGVRDRALILTAYALGLRSSDVVWLDAVNVRPASARPDGLDITVTHSKTDQTGEGGGVTLALAPGTRLSTCPVNALREWLAQSGLTEGPLFRSIGKGESARLGTERMTTRSVSRILQRAAGRAGVPVDRISGHSPRAGFATTAYAAGIPESEIARTGRWRSVTVARSYDQSSRWTNPASGGLGL